MLVIICLILVGIILLLALLPGLMQRSPKPSSESMWSWSPGSAVIGQGVLLAAAGMAARSRVWTFWPLGPSTNLCVFADVAVSSLLQLGIIELPFARPIYETTEHSMREWLVLVALALTPVTVIEVVKLIRQFPGRTTPSDSPETSL